MRDASLEFFQKLVATPSPSGFERPVADLFREYVRPFAHKVTTDVMGNVTAIINPEAPMRFMYAGHMDEIGFIIHYIDENGFLFFSTIGGTDVATEIGQRVWVHVVCFRCRCAICTPRRRFFASTMCKRPSIWFAPIVDD